MRKIWVLCGGPSTEHEVSLKSGRVVCSRIALGHQSVRPVVITRDGQWIICDREMKAERDREAVQRFFEAETGAAGPVASCNVGRAIARMIEEEVDCAFLALHGQWGEDGRAQGLLEAACIPFTGSRLLASACAFSKTLTLDAYRRAGLRVARSVEVTDAEREMPEAMTVKLPVFVKPVRGGSSVGMSCVHNPDELEPAINLALSVDNAALVEEKIEGAEVSCGVLDLVRNNRTETVVMPATEIRPVEAEYFDYEAKYTPGKTLEVTPAELPEDILLKIQDSALRAHKVLGCEGMSRTDMIVPFDGDRTPVLLETNTLPGMTPTSLLPQQAMKYGITVEKFFDGLIEHALFRGTS